MPAPSTFMTAACGLLALGALAACGGAEQTRQDQELSIRWRAPDPDTAPCANRGVIHTPPAVSTRDDATITLRVEDGVTCGDALTRDAHAALWLTGFRFEWERHVVGFQTPHRVSDLAALLDRERHSVAQGQWRARADATFRFEPGVDGDQASPRATWTGITHPELFVTRATARVQVTDELGTTEPPEARTRVSHRVKFPLNRADMNHGKLDHVVPLLRGLGVRTRCLNDDQPEDRPCNSNGMWPQRMFFGLERCAREADALACDLIVEIDRGWTPTKGGGKPLNVRLRLDVEAQITVLGGPAHVLASREGGVLQEQRRAREGGVSQTTTLTGTPNMARGLLGLQALGVDLLPTDGYKKRGRYMSALTMNVKPRRYDPTTGAMTLRWDAGFKIPSTVLDTVARYSVKPALIQTNVDALVMPERAISGDVCFSGFAFNCAARERAIRTEHTVPIQAGAER